MSKLAIILFFAVWNNIGNLAYWTFQIWFHWTHINIDMTWELYFRLQAYNHTFIVLPFGMLLFYIREYRKSI